MLERRAGIPFHDLDVFLNVTGGMRLLERGTDLAIVAALLSSVADRPAPADAIFVGEVVGAEVLKEGEPMTYAYYHQVKRGSTPKTAPSYIQKEKEKELKVVLFLTKVETRKCAPYLIKIVMR